MRGISLSLGMPRRKKPARYLEYWTGPVNRDAGIKSVLVCCCGTINHSKGSAMIKCHHVGRFARIYPTGIGTIFQRTSGAAFAEMSVTW